MEPTETIRVRLYSDIIEIQIIDSLNEILNDIDNVDLDNKKYKQTMNSIRENQYNKLFLTDHRRESDSNKKKLNKHGKNNAMLSLKNKIQDYLNSSNKSGAKNYDKFANKMENNIHSFSKNLNEELKRININYGKLGAHKRFIEDKTSMDNFKSSNYESYRIKVISEHNNLFRSKLKPLNLGKENGMEKMANKVFNMANKNKEEIKNIVKKYNLKNVL